MVAMFQDAGSKVRDTMLPDAIDASRYYLPEAFTPLYYTPGYALLTEEQRMRYNQITGLYFNEQLIFFETFFVDFLLNPLLDRPRDADFSARIRAFKNDELRHSEVFAELNRLCAPDLYRDSPFYFIRIPRGWRRVLQFTARRPQCFPFLIWLIMFQEEKAVSYAKGFEAEKETLEPHFVDTQRRHMEDEASHVEYDTLLLDTYWEPAGRYTQHLNASLLSWSLFEFFGAPKRSGMNVLDHLLREFEDLVPLRRRIRHWYWNLQRNPTYLRSLYGPRVTPNTLRRLRQSGVCKKLVRRLDDAPVAAWGAGT